MYISHIIGIALKCPLILLKQFENQFFLLSKMLQFLKSLSHNDLG